MILGIESTAHTFGVGLVDDRILANVKDVYVPPLGWGIAPDKAAEHHRDVAEGVLSQALKQAGASLSDVTKIAYSAGPGLSPPLIFGRDFAVKLAKKYNKPLVPVNHCVAHIEVARFSTGAKDPVMLYTSGGNTQVITFESGRYRVFGETQDISIGNLVDVFAREAGLSTPGGPVIEKLASKGKNYIKLPYVVKGMDVSFSGILTNLKQKLGKYPIEDLAYSLQETCFAMLIEVSERAMAHCKKDEFVVTGGVAANKRLQQMAGIMCKERGAKFYPLDTSLAGDNGAMIAVVGKLDNRTVDPDHADIIPKWRTDQVEVVWR